jgi:hypothetical protein
LDSAALVQIVSAKVIALYLLEANQRYVESVSSVVRSTVIHISHGQVKEGAITTRNRNCSQVAVAVVSAAA